MTEPYSSVGLTGERYKAFKGDTSLNSTETRFYKT